LKGYASSDSYFRECCRLSAPRNISEFSPCDVVLIKQNSMPELRNICHLFRSHAACRSVFSCFFVYYRHMTHWNVRHCHLLSDKCSYSLNRRNEGTSDCSPIRALNNCAFEAFGMDWDIGTYFVDPMVSPDVAIVSSSHTASEQN
jgi:hypothetical protein